MDVFAFEYFVFLLCDVKNCNAKAQNHSCEGNNTFKVFVTNECENTLQRKCVLQIRFKKQCRLYIYVCYWKYYAMSFTKILSMSSDLI